jgi:hypothetical protein
MQAGNESLPLGATRTADGWRIVRPVAAAVLGAARRIAGALGRSCQLHALAPLSDREIQDMGLTPAEVMAGKTKCHWRKDALAGEPWPVAIIHDDLRAA